MQDNLFQIMHSQLAHLFFADNLCFVSRIRDKRGGEEMSNTQRYIRMRPRVQNTL